MIKVKSTALSWVLGSFIISSAFAISDEKKIESVDANASMNPVLFDNSKGEVNENVEAQVKQRHTKAEQDNDAKALVAILSSMESISGKFEQRIDDPDGTQLQLTHGTFKIKRPGFLYWKTSPPYEQLVVSDSKTLWVFDPDLEQVTIKNSDVIDNGPAHILNGDLAEINSQYIIQETSNTQAVENKDSVDPSDTVFTLTPVNVTGGAFARVDIHFIKNILAKITMLDKLGQSTTIVFTQTIINQTMADTDFVFVPPTGVDVITDS